MNFLLAEFDRGINVETIGSFLGSYYLLLAAMNGVAAMYLWRRKNSPGWGAGLVDWWRRRW